MTNKKAKKIACVVTTPGIGKTPDDGPVNPKVGDKLSLTEDQFAAMSGKVRRAEDQEASQDVAELQTQLDAANARADKAGDPDALEAETKRADEAEEARDAALASAEELSGLVDEGKGFIEEGSKLLKAETKRADDAEKKLEDAEKKAAKKAAPKKDDKLPGADK